MEEYKEIKNLTPGRLKTLDMAEALMFQYLGAPQDYSIETLEIIEELMRDKIPEGKEVIHWSTYMPFGWYYGKVIVKNIEGAKWVGDGSDPMELSIQFKIKDGSQSVMFPFKRIMNWWRDHTDGLVPFFKMMDYFNRYGIPNESDADKDGWIEKDGFKMRVTKKEMDLYKHG